MLPQQSRPMANFTVVKCSKTFLSQSFDVQLRGFIQASVRFPVADRAALWQQKHRKHVKGGKHLRCS